MKIAAFLYLADVLNKTFLILGAITSVFSALVFFCVLSIIVVKITEEEENKNDWYLFCVKNIKKMVISWLCLLSLCLIIPSKEFMYVAGGLYLGNEALENPKVKTLIEKSYRILDDKLNAILKENEGVTK